MSYALDAEKDEDVTQYSSSNKRSYGIGTVSVGLTVAFCGRNKFVRYLGISKGFPSSS